MKTTKTVVFKVWSLLLSASASLKFLEIQILGSGPDLLNQKLGGEAQPPAFLTNPPGDSNASSTLRRTNLEDA